MIAGFLVEIRTRHILNTSLDLIRSRVFVGEGSEYVQLWLMGDYVAELLYVNSQRKLKISGYVAAFFPVFQIAFTKQLYPFVSRDCIALCFD